MKVCLACERCFDDAGWRCPGCGWSPPMLEGVPAFAPDIAVRDIGFDPSHFARFAELEASSFWFRSRNRLIVWALGCCFPQARNLLEVGCGTGYVLSGVSGACPHLELYGADIFAEGLRFARRRLPGATLFQMDARRIPFSGHFDVIGAFDVLEHVDEDEMVLRAMHRAVRPGGGILLTVPQHRFLWSVQDECGHHRRRYERSELLRKIERAGFSVMRCTSFVCLLLPLMLLSRLAKRQGRAGVDPFAELKVPRALNVLLEKVMGIERWVVERGVLLPAGGSLLVAARKTGPVS